MAKAIGRTTIDGGWYRVDLVEVSCTGTEVVMRLDPDSLVVNHRDPRYWLAMALMPFRVVREWWRSR